MPPPLLAAYAALALIAYPAAWLKGGHPERMGAMICLANWLAAFVLQDVRVGELRIAETVLDVILLGLFARMALNGRRWWPLAATAVMALILITHAAPPLMPELTFRGGVVARIALSILLLVVLLAGVLERWLAGEAPVSAGRLWRPRRGGLNI